MPTCPNCHNAALERVHRSFVERLLYRKVQQCGRCGYRQRERRVPFETDLAFALSNHTRCIQCGNPRVRRLPKRDGVDPMSSHPLSVLAGLARAPIYHCNPCRLQYHDWRPVNPAVVRDRVAPVETSDAG